MGSQSQNFRKRIPGRAWGPLSRWALLAAVALAAWPVVAAPLRAQSLLSMERPLSIGADERMARAETAHLTVWEMFEEVQEGRGAQVYGLLYDRMADALDNEPVEDKAEFHREYLLNLLRAGHGWAPPGELEDLARAFITNYPDDKRFPQAFYFLNHALDAQGRPLETSFFFDEDALTALPDWMQSRYLRLLSRHAARDKKPLEAAGLLVREMQNGGSLHISSPFEVEELLGLAPGPKELEEFLAKHPDVEWLAKRANFLRMRALVNAGELHQALIGMGRLEAEGRLDDAEERQWASALRLEIGNLSRLRRKRIGVLLPLGSRSAVLRQLALETLDGLRMAVQYPGGADQDTGLSSLLGQDLPGGGKAGEQGYELVVRDSGNSRDLVEKMMRELVEHEQVMAVIGPVARGESEEAAKMAEKLGVPVISLSISMDMPKDARFAFRHSKSYEQEVRDLVRFAMDYRHLRRFAILYPDTSYGRSMMSLFWEEVEANGGRIAAAGAFTPSVLLSRLSMEKVGLKELFQRFTGVDRHLTEEDQAWLAAVDDKTPDPIVDFDGLFIPIGPTGIQDLQLIAPYPATVDAENVVLLGSRFWNDPSVLVASDGKMRGAVFLDSYDAVSAHPKVAEFQARHRTFFGHRPQYRLPTYYTALAYDTARILMGLLEPGKIRSRVQLRNALVEMEPYFGITGHTRFLDGGEAEKESMFFQLVEKDIVRLRP